MTRIFMVLASITVASALHIGTTPRTALRTTSASMLLEPAVTAVSPLNEASVILAGGSLTDGFAAVFPLATAASVAVTHLLPAIIHAVPPRLVSRHALVRARLVRACGAQWIFSILFGKEVAVQEDSALLPVFMGVAVLGTGLILSFATGSVAG